MNDARPLNAQHLPAVRGGLVESDGEPDGLEDIIAAARDFARSGNLNGLMDRLRAPARQGDEHPAARSRQSERPNPLDTSTAVEAPLSAGSTRHNPTERALERIRKL